MRHVIRERARPRRGWGTLREGRTRPTRKSTEQAAVTHQRADGDARPMSLLHDTAQRPPPLSNHSKTGRPGSSTSAIQTPEKPDAATHSKIQEPARKNQSGGTRPNGATDAFNYHYRGDMASSACFGVANYGFRYPASGFVGRGGPHSRAESYQGAASTNYCLSGQRRTCFLERGIWVVGRVSAPPTPQT